MAVAFEVQHMREILATDEAAIVAHHLEELDVGGNAGGRALAEEIRTAEPIDAAPIVVDELAAHLFVAAFAEIEAAVGMTDDMRRLYARCRQLANGPE